MSYFFSPSQLAHAWRQLADNANESGETPLFGLGHDSLYRGGLLKLLALGRIARQNLGPQHPIVVTGGDGWLWLLAMLVWRPAVGGRRLHSAAVPSAASEEEAEVPLERSEDADRTVLYAGADSAQYAAVLNLEGQRGGRGAMPTGLDWSVRLPTSEDGEGSDVELLPAVINQSSLPRSEEPVDDDWIRRGERWAGVLLAIVLLISSIFG